MASVPNPIRKWIQRWVTGVGSGEVASQAPVQSVNSQTGDVTVAAGGVIPSSQTVATYDDLPVTDRSQAEIWFVTGEEDIVASTQLSPVQWRSMSDYTLVASALPDSAVLHAVASNYDGGQWVSDIGPNIPDGTSGPNKTSITENSTTFDVVNYENSNNEYSETTELDLTADKQAIIYTVKNIDIGVSSDDYYVDNSDGDDFAHLHDGGSGHRVFSASGADSTGGSPDSNLHVFCLEGIDFSGTPELNLYRDGTGSVFVSATGGWGKLDGLTLATKGGGTRNGDRQFAEVTVLENHSTQDRDNEVQRQKDKYNI